MITKNDTLEGVKKYLNASFLEERSEERPKGNKSCGAKENSEIS